MSFRIFATGVKLSNNHSTISLVTEISLSSQSKDVSACAWPE